MFRQNKSHQGLMVPLGPVGSGIHEHGSVDLDEQERGLDYLE